MANDECRTCLKKTKNLLPLNSIIDEENNNVKDYLKKYVQIECSDCEYPLHKNICIKCFNVLLDVRNYIIQCHQSENYLKLKSCSPHSAQIEIKCDILYETKEFTDSLDNFDDMNIENNINYEYLMDKPEYNLCDELENDKYLETIEYLEKTEDLDLETKSENLKLTMEDEFEHFEEKSVYSDELLSDDWDKITVLKKKKFSKKKEKLMYGIFENESVKCVVCNLIFSNSSEYQNHKCIKEKTKQSSNFEVSLRCRHSCDFCECSFLLLGNLYRHMVDNHQDNTEKINLNDLNLSCPICDKQYTQKHNKQNITNKRKNKFVCALCGKIYKNRQNMKEHEFAHKGIKPYKCEYCGKEFAQECVKRSHLKLHTGKDVNCQVCDKTFVSTSQLRFHMTYHTNNLKYACDKCPKRFRQNHVLQVHKKSHSGRRTEQCEHCDSYFYTKDDVRTHMNSVHLKPYHCHLCINRYSEPGRLRQHFIKVHNVEIQDVSIYKKKKNELEILKRSRKFNEK